MDESLVWTELDPLLELKGEPGFATDCKVWPKLPPLASAAAKRRVSLGDGESLGGHQHQEYPEYIRGREVNELHPHRRLEENVDGSEKKLSREDRECRKAVATRSFADSLPEPEHDCGDDGEGDKGRRRMVEARSESVATSADSPGTMPAVKTRVSPSAVTAPLAPTTSTEKSAAAVDTTTRRRAPESERLVPTREPRGEGHRRQEKERVHQVEGHHETRASETFEATHSNRTSPAPMSASATTRRSETTANRRAGWPEGRTRARETVSARTRIPRSPLDRRWPNSIRVSTVGSRGMTTPLHRGQWLPQPAPAPVARTKAPQRMTRTV